MNMNYQSFNNFPTGDISNQQNYYLNQGQTVKPTNISTDNILFVADLPDETCEEDLANFFKAYNFIFAKIFK
jgi:hypothetical protein